MDVYFSSLKVVKVPFSRYFVVLPPQIKGHQIPDFFKLLEFKKEMAWFNGQSFGR